MAVLDLIKQNIKDAESVTVIAGYLDRRGWDLLHKEMCAAVSRKCPVRVFSDAHFSNTNYSLLFGLNRKLNKTGRNFYGNVFRASGIKMLHAKMLIFAKPGDKYVVIASSANITGPALRSNLELGIQVEVQRTDKLYEDLSDIVGFLQENAHEPTREEVGKYRRFRERMDALDRKRRQLERHTPLRAKRPEPKRHSAEKFRNELKLRFDEPEFIADMQERSEDPSAKEKDETGRAVRRFTKLVLSHRRIFSKQNNFKLLLRIYANILHYTHNKPKLEELLEDLESIIPENNLADQFYDDSIPGRYAGLTRNVSVKSPISRPHIAATLVLLGKFYDDNDNDYETLCEAFETFCKKTGKMKPRPIAFVTGILEALQPDLFVVCNARTRFMGEQLVQKQYRRILRSNSLENYLEFNEIFRHIAERSGITGMRKIDLIANSWWELR